MGWIREGKLVIPDGNPDPGTAEVDGEQVTPSGLIVKAKPEEPKNPPRAQVRQIKKMIKRMNKKQKKEEHNRFLADRFGYLKITILKPPKPKEVHASEIKENK